MSAVPSASLPRVVSRNGHLIPPEEATLSVLGETLYGAYGVYESIQLWNGTLFHLADHLQRLAHSAAQIDLALPGTLPAHEAWIRAVIAAEGVERALIRLVVLGPDGKNGALAFAWLTPPRIPTPEMVVRGVGAITYLGERALPTAKTLNTLVNTLARRRAQAAGEHEGLLVDREGCVREGATSNFYVVRDGGLFLPPADTILEGVTLQIVVQLAGALGIPVERRPLPLAERDTWDEAFLTSTSRHVLPLVRLDGHPIGPGTPGPITRELQRRFEDYFESVVGAPYMERVSARTASHEKRSRA